MKGLEKFSTYLNFEREEIYADLAIQIARLRQDNGYSQKELAKLLKTTQQTVSRLEDPSNNGLSLNTLIKLAQTFHKNLRIQFV
jgi:transcriptional regulator with XRE-family HTH domain